jgi:Cu(I)/Ag(I) efflux system membrane fusion protein
MRNKTRLFITGSVILIISLLVLFFLFTRPDDTADKGQGLADEQNSQLWTCGMHPEVITDEPGQCPKCGMDLVPLKQTTASQETQSEENPENKENHKDRTILYWQAPMDPTEIYDHPGKSKMGMDLVPVYEDESVKSSSNVIIDPVTVQNMGVRYTSVKRMDFSREIRAVGLIDYNEEHLYTINTKISGWIEKLYVNFTGKMVQKGQPLLEIYSPDLVTTQEEYLLAYHNNEAVSSSRFASIRDGAESLLKSTRQRLDYWDIPANEIERLENTGEVRKTLRLEAPTSGVVIHKNALEGLHVQAGMELFKIADLSTVWIEAGIYDYELPWIKKNQSATVELSYLPDKKYQGRVSYIYPYLDDKSRTIKIRLEFSNPDLELKPGMYADVYLQGKTLPGALVIPNQAIIRTGTRNVVFVARGEGKFESRDIKTGETGGPGNNYVRVLAGLMEGEKIVTSAQFMLDSESRLQESIQKMLNERQQKSRPMEAPKKKQMESIPGMKHDHEPDSQSMQQVGTEGMNM